MFSGVFLQYGPCACYLLWRGFWWISARFSCERLYQRTPCWCFCTHWLVRRVPSGKFVGKMEWAASAPSACPWLQFGNHMFSISPSSNGLFTWGRVYEWSSPRFLTFNESFLNFPRLLAPKAQRFLQVTPQTGSVQNVWIRNRKTCSFAGLDLSSKTRRGA